MVRMAIGPLVLVVSRLRKAGLAVRPPMAEGGVPAIGAAPEVWAVVEKAAVAAVVGDAAAREHVLGKLLKREGKLPAAPDYAASGVAGPRRRAAASTSANASRA